MARITTLEALAALYGLPGDASLVKEVASLTPEYRALIAASPFVVLATSGPEGLDCSPRGDQPGFVHVQDDSTLLLPDRRGNNRSDSLRNIVRDPRVALLFLLPGAGTTVRVNGQAYLTTDADVLAAFTVDGQAPRSVIVVTVQAVYFQCARAIVRADLWNPERHIPPGSLPTPGAILSALSECRIGGPAYDAAWPERARQSLW